MKPIATIPVYYHPANSEDIISVYGYVPIAKSIVNDVNFYKTPTAMARRHEEVTGVNIDFTIIYTESGEFSTPLTIEELENAFSDVHYFKPS